MTVKYKIFKNTYRDSIALMRIARELGDQEGIEKAEVLLGTPANLDALEHNGLYLEGMSIASVNDLVVSIEAHSDEDAQKAFNSAEQLLKGGSSINDYEMKNVAFSVETAIRRLPNANLLLLSVPGPFVMREALHGLENGLNLLIFSDNVPIEDELKIKQFGEERNLLVMGPDCGTAIISGAALAFANEIRRGNIGIVAASGTGLQEVSCLIDRAGYGISQAIGTGSNDAKDIIGGITTLRGLQMLEEDKLTEVIVIITKPPQHMVMNKILKKVKSIKKPVIINFIGQTSDIVLSAGAIYAESLEDTARKAVEALGGKFNLECDDQNLIVSASNRLVDSQKYIRGLYSGGTFAAEAGLLLSNLVESVNTNFYLPQANFLKNMYESIGHSCVDMGDDEFTRGKPHPMLDPLMREKRILQEAADPETAVILLDVVLGHGVHPNPAGIIKDTLDSAKEIAASSGRFLSIVASVCGTERDPQVWSEQVALLRQSGVMVFSSNARAVRAAVSIASRQNIF
jgi:FdrA protein